VAVGTLLVSRNIKWHTKYKKRLEELGFKDVTVTALERDALEMLIREIKPKILMMSASFYKCITPYKMGELKRKFPKINMAALSIEDYEPDLAMYFILNGAKAYVGAYDGPEQWYKGLECVKSGKEFISPSVMERIEQRGELPEAVGLVTKKQKEVIRLICNGFEEKDIADNLHVSVRTVAAFKRDIYTSCNVRNSLELMRFALTEKYVSDREIYFSPRGLVLNPRPIKKVGSGKEEREMKKNYIGGKRDYQD